MDTVVARERYRSPPLVPITKCNRCSALDNKDNRPL